MALHEVHSLRELQQHLLLEHLDVAVLPNLREFPEHRVADAVTAVQTENVEVHLDLLDRLHQAALLLHGVLGLRREGR